MSWEEFYQMVKACASFSGLHPKDQEHILLMIDGLIYRGKQNV